MVAPPDCPSQAEYIKYFRASIAVMQTEEALERIAYELCVDSSAENIDYLEVRWAPRLHLRRGLTVEQVIRAVLSGLDSGPIEAVAIVCAMRQHTPDENVELARLAGNFAGRDVVGFDLAGDAGGADGCALHDQHRLAHRGGNDPEPRVRADVGSRHDRRGTSTLQPDCLRGEVRLADAPPRPPRQAGRRKPQPLVSGSEQAVAEVAQARHDICLVVEALVQRRGIDVDLGMALLEHPHAFRRGHDADHPCVAAARLLDQVQGLGGRASR